MFNFWRRYPRRKPKEEGWYQCTVQHGYGIDEPMVMDLYFWFKPDHGGVWVDRRRQKVFDGYKVYQQCRAPIDDNRVFTDYLCEREDVIAWKKLPKCFVQKGGLNNE